MNQSFNLDLYHPISAESKGFDYVASSGILQNLARLFQNCDPNNDYDDTNGAVVFSDNIRVLGRAKIEECIYAITRIAAICYTDTLGGCAEHEYDGVTYGFDQAKENNK